METGKTGRYFKYAIGEIILVVIGILIALQINNWNEASKEKNKEATYLKNIRRDLVNQMKSIDDQIENESSFVNISTYLINSFSEETFKTIDTSFFAKLTELQSRKTFLITDPTYTDLLSSGNIDIFKNKEFKDNLIQYYQELERVEKIIQNNNSLLVDQQYASVFLKLGYYFNEEVIGQNNYMNSNSSIKPIEYKGKLASTAKQLLQKEENVLQLMNIIGLRNAAGISSLNFMKSSKKNTEILLSELNKITND